MSETCDLTSLGNLARIFRGITCADIAAAKEVQQNYPDLPLGECMVRTGRITTDDLSWLLAKQERMRAGIPGRADVMQVVDYAADFTRTCGTGVAELLRAVFGGL
jgi:hypothetical protein